MNDYTKLFQNACLVQFSTSSWQCTKALNTTIIKDKVDIDSDWFRGRKYLINPDLLGPIHTAQHQARNHISKHALPFPIQTLSLVPKERLEAIEKQLELCKKRFWECVDQFIPLYVPAREEARQVLGDLFNEEDYPEDITKKFKFEWRYLALGVPGKASILTPAIYAREKEKFQALMEETREIAMSALCKEFSEVVSHLTEKLHNNDGKIRSFKANMFNNLHDFLNDLNDKNLFDDDRLRNLSDQAKNLIAGINPSLLQYNVSMRERIQQDMQSLKNAIDESLIDLPRRKLRLAA